MLPFSDLRMHEWLYADSERVNRYVRAIEDHIQEGDVVLDVGSGTGFLGLLAARQGAEVYAIEKTSIVHLAKRIARHNNLDNIEFIKADLRNFSMTKEVDWIVHELIGYTLFNEEMVSKLLGLKQRLLKSDGKILPGEFDFYLQPVELYPEYVRPFIWEHNIKGLDLSFLRNDPVTQEHREANNAPTTIFGPEIKAYIGEIEPILSFNLNKIDRENDFPDSLTGNRTVTDHATLHGMLTAFGIRFDDSNHYTSFPREEYRDWINVLLKVYQAPVAPGDVVKYELQIPEVSDWTSWSVASSINRHN